MPPVERLRDRGRREARRTLERLATELRVARLDAGISQRQVAAACGVSQPVISRIERAVAEPSIEVLALLCAALGLDLSVGVYPAGSPVRDAGQLRLIDRLRPRVHPAWRSATEVLIGQAGDRRAWDVCLSGPGTVGIDAETRLHDLQSLQRRIEAKARDSGVDRVVLLVAATRHNALVLREHREALRSTFPLETREVMLALREYQLPRAGGILVL